MVRKKYLLPDEIKSTIVPLRKIYFLIRSFLNPFIFWGYLLFKKESVIFFNDFDQATSIFWSPFFHLLRGRHRFAVMLHDPDRDLYFSVKKLSEVSMKAITSFMDWGIYHEQLPNKIYYQNKTTYFSVPHGIFQKDSEEDPELSKTLFPLQKNYITCSILGNIRKEKNYEAAIRALKNNPRIHLIIAGKEASSAFRISTLKNLAQEVGVSEQITWINRYLSDRQMNSVVKNSSVVLMNYASTFTSQSGILNLIAPYSPNLLVSKTASALFLICREYKLGRIIEADSQDSLKNVFSEWNSVGISSSADWTSYKKYASWENNVKIASSNFFCK